MSARDDAIARQLARQTFLDNLNAEKDAQLRSTMNSGLMGPTDAQVVAPKDRNPNSLENIRERQAIQVQNVESRDAYQDLKQKNFIDGMIPIALVGLAYFALK